MKKQVTILTAASSPVEDASALALEEALAGQKLSELGRFTEACSRYAEALRLQPDDPRYHWLMADCQWKLGHADTAGWHLHAAVQANSNFAAAQASLGQWHLIHGMVDLALEASAASLALEPDNGQFIEMRAWVLEAAGELDAAWALVQRLLNGGHVTISVVKLFGRMARSRGKGELALQLVQQTLRATSDNTADGLDYVAADLLDSLGRYDEAFAHAARGNRLRRRPYDPDQTEQFVDRVIQYFTRDQLAALPKATYLADRPVLIVGMPRSGSSLIEQILSSHPDVYGAGELDFMPRVIEGTLKMLSAGIDDFPQCFDNLSVGHANGLSQIYLEPLKILSSEAKRVTDKWPLNFLHLGLISLLLPRARVINCQRNPLDICLSCFMAGFTSGNEFTLDLVNCGRFYRSYVRLMDHWKTVIDLPILDVSYEELVGDQEAQSRRMIEFLGLPWDDRCLQFHKNRRPVATASVHQIRQPIYTTSRERWRNYEKHLGPLKEALQIA